MISSPRDRRFAYNLRFDSDFALPDLPADTSSGAPDVRIELGRTLPLSEVEELLASQETTENVLRFEPGYCSVLFSEVGRLSVLRGEHILVEPIEGTSASTWRLPLLGAIMALLLEERGLFALHAGAVEMKNADGMPIACAFAGDKGQGKSTLGAALSLAGLPLLCDDVLGLQMPQSRAESPLALVGFGGMKLVPDAVRAVLGRSPDELARVAPELDESEGFDKRHFIAPLAKAAQPLRHIFLLASHDETSGREDISPRALGPQEALLMLLPHTFGARWGELYLKDARRTAHFKTCAQIVGSCRVWELSRRRDFALLPQTIELLLRIAASSD